jgi:hypothetical protein
VTSYKNAEHRCRRGLTMVDARGSDALGGVRSSGTDHGAHDQQSAASDQQPSLDQHLAELANEGHMPMANRLSLVSWGDQSSPSLPSVDSQQAIVRQFFKQPRHRETAEGC